MDLAIIVGTLKKPPELRKSDNGNFYMFGSLMVRKAYVKKGGHKYKFLNFTAFGKTAEFINEKFGEGSGIAILGHHDVNATNYKMSIIIDKVFFTLSSAIAAVGPTEDGFGAVEDDDDLFGEKPPF